MFDWVLNTPLNTINFFFWRFQIKVNDFFNFFSTINFSYQYLPEAKAYLEPSQACAFYPTQVFSGEFCEILKTPFLQNTSRQLLLFSGKNILSIK